MTKTILDYNVTIASPATNGAAPLLTLAPGAGAQIAPLAIHIDPAHPASHNNRVDLKATIGVQALTGNPLAAVRILRAGVEIFNSVSHLETGFQAYNVITVTFAEHAPLGTQNYQLAIQNLGPAGDFSVVGPVIFSALALG